MKTIVEWNGFLWDLVVKRLHQSKGRLYLSFDESLLTDAMRSRGIEVSSEGVLADFNAMMRSHCRPTASGFIGLTKEPGGAVKKDNWSWVCIPNHNDVSLCLTFVAQQILAAELMQGTSYYAAYWGMFGVRPEEDRINPFNDGGQHSFRGVWETLRRELKRRLTITDNEITFEYGNGPNKYRSLPISQSLLNERDLKTLSLAISLVDSLSDDALYSEMTRVRLSPSGMRKIVGGALREQFIRQFRDYIELPDTVPDQERRKEMPPLVSGVKIPGLALVEEYEVFEGSVFHCAYEDPTISVNEALRFVLEERRSVVFAEIDGRAPALEKQVLPEAERQVWVLLKEPDSGVFLNSHVPGQHTLLLSKYFERVETSLPAMFELLQCIALPAELEFVDISGLEPKNTAGNEPSENVRLIGGLCVNEKSNKYICGFGPTRLLLNGVEMDESEVCLLDFEETSLGSAMHLLSTSTLPRDHFLDVNDKRLRVSMVSPQPRSQAVTAYLSAWSILTPGCASIVDIERFLPLSVASDVLVNPWVTQRRKRAAFLAADILRGNCVWKKTSEDVKSRCLVTLAYLDIPDASRDAVRIKIVHTGLVPCSLERALK